MGVFRSTYERPVWKNDYMDGDRTEESDSYCLGLGVDRFRVQSFGFRVDRRRRGVIHSNDNIDWMEHTCDYMNPRTLNPHLMLNPRTLNPLNPRTLNPHLMLLRHTRTRTRVKT